MTRSRERSELRRARGRDWAGSSEHRDVQSVASPRRTRHQRHTRRRSELVAPRHVNDLGPEVVSIEVFRRQQRDDASLERPRRAPRRLRPRGGAARLTHTHKSPEQRAAIRPE